MNNLPQIKKTSQAPYTLYRFNPATMTGSFVEVEPPTTFKPLRKPEIGEHEKRHIEKLKDRNKGLDPETLQSLIQYYINNVLNSPVDDHPLPGLNAPKPWTEKGIEHKEDTQGQGAKPGRMSIDDAEARKNRAREEQYRVTSQRPVKTRTKPLKAPKKQEKALATAPKKRAKVRRLNVPPHDVVKYGKTLDLWACWSVIYRQMYVRSRFGTLHDMPHYPRKSARTGRYYFCGNAYLARLCGLDERTVKLVLKQLEFENLIYTRYHGYKGRGCSIIEVPVNKRHVWKWCRQPGRQKTST